MKLILNIARYYIEYNNREKETKREHKSVLYYFTSVFFTLQYRFYLQDTNEQVNDQTN